MIKYVDRDALIEFANNHIGGIDANDIARFPGADVREVTRGEWVVSHFGGEHYATCTHCRIEMEISPHYLRNMKFCPNCGAEMSIKKNGRG